jgi:tetraacyldisaccharide 4'-kinase
MRAPEFWEAERGGAAAAALTPLSWLYDLGAQFHHGLTQTVRASVPVVCVGNFTAGGAGKTPTVLALANTFVQAGLTPHLLTRGYGGRTSGPLRVDPAAHDSQEVGDEALLLAAAGTTWVARERPRGAEAAVAAGADLIVMDDGLQNPSLKKDLSLAVIDGGFGLGNGHSLPAGPLREPIARGLRRADALVLIGPDRHGVLHGLGSLTMPVIQAELVPGLEAYELRERAVVGFAGIGRPSKFFETLTAVGCEVIARYSFADHHRYEPNEIMEIVEHASAEGAVPVTTTKDYVRLPAEARPMVRTLSITLEWRDPEQLNALLAPIVERCRGA